MLNYRNRSGTVVDRTKQFPGGFDRIYGSNSFILTNSSPVIRGKNVKKGEESVGITLMKKNLNFSLIDDFKEKSLEHDFNSFVASTAARNHDQEGSDFLTKSYVYPKRDFRNGSCDLVSRRKGSNSSFSEIKKSTISKLLSKKLPSINPNSSKIRKRRIDFFRNRKKKIEKVKSNKLKKLFQRKKAEASSFSIRRKKMRDHKRIGVGFEAMRETKLREITDYFDQLKFEEERLKKKAREAASLKPLDFFLKKADDKKKTRKVLRPWRLKRSIKKSQKLKLIQVRDKQG